MRIGFDYGTSNCAVALMSEGRVHRLPLDGDDFYLPSTLFAPHRDAIADLLATLLPPSSQAEFVRDRQLAIAKGRRLRAGAYPVTCRLLPHKFIFNQYFSLFFSLCQSFSPYKAIYLVVLLLIKFDHS